KGEVRADIQALRAIAVGAVMAFHLWPDRLTGGYVGVDVFFAISGFLITSHLLAEIDATGHLRPTRFWARRAKRLVPASTIVLVLTVVGVVTWVPKALWRQFLTEVVASTLQVQNWLLAHDSVDYLAANNSPSPTQHFWTLSVEEQFYVVLPLLLLAAIVVARILRAGRRQVILTGLLVTVACSLSYSIWLTATTPGVAYFSTFTRAWEFGAGALLAYAGSSARRRRALTWFGVVAIVAACVIFDSTTSFPGVAAALPVVGTVVVIWAGRRSTFSRFGALPPVALLGRVSYAAYLWHWPLIALLPYITHRSLDNVDKIGIIAATVVLAWLSTTFIEDPIRFRPQLLGQRRPLTVAAWSAAAMAVVIGFSAAEANGLVVHEKQLAKVARKVVAEKPSCLGAQAMDPAFAPCSNPALAGVLVPDPAQAKADQKYRPDCLGMQSAIVPRICQVGPRAGYVKRIFAAGDSHNNVLLGVYSTMAKDNNWRIDVASHNGCYLTTARNVPSSDGSEKECMAWRAGVMTLIGKGVYDAIIVTHAQPIIPGKGETADQATVAGLIGAWRNLPGVPIVAIRDNPWTRPDVLSCVSQHLSTAADACAVTRSKGLATFDGQAEAALQVSRAHLVDVTSMYCTATQCPPVIGHVLVYKDRTHLTATFAATLAPYIERQVVAALAG
ncbi:MAG: acyltransferase family protein, partial [Dermatophilaceae bacterium]